MQAKNRCDQLGRQYGPGVGFKFSAGLLYDGRSILSLGHESHYIHSVNGNSVESYVNVTRIKLDLPLRGFAGASLEYLLNASERYYDDFPDVSARSPELRLAFQWAVD